MGEFISVCTCLSFAVALTLIAPGVCIAADIAAACRRSPGSTDGRSSATASAAAALAGTLAARLCRCSLRRKVDVGDDGPAGTSHTNRASGRAFPPDVGEGGATLSPPSELVTVDAALASI